MKYKFVGGAAFAPGLPAQDVDDETLSDEQKITLSYFVAAGLYAPVEDAPAPAVKGRQPKTPPEQPAQEVTPQAG